MHIWCLNFLLQKFVCTTIRPTLLEFKELYNWDGAAEFVADYLNIEPLKPEYELVCPFLQDTKHQIHRKENWMYMWKCYAG